MIITIAGLPGAGKTSLAKFLAEKLGMRYYSIGDLRGRMALELGITIDELNAQGDESNRKADEYQKKVGQTEDNIIVDGWISWFMIPHSFKVLLTIDPAEGAERVYEEKKKHADERPDERRYTSVADARATLDSRLEHHRAIFARLYGVENFADPKQYDIVVDTTGSPGPEQNSRPILAELRKRNLIA